MKYIRITIIGIVVSSVLIFVGAIAIKGISSHSSINHNMASNSKKSVDHSAEHNVTNDSGQVTSTVKIEDTNNVNSYENVKNDNSNLAKVPDDVVFVKYIVRENDTLWRIANTYMPEYNAYPVEDKEGVIAFIVKENNLQKINDGSYIIYSGQTLIIPKQKNIAINSYTNKSSTAKQSNLNSSATSSSNIKKENNNTDISTVASNGQSSQVNQADHSNHTEHN